MEILTTLWSLLIVKSLVVALVVTALMVIGSKYVRKYRVVVYIAALIIISYVVACSMTGNTGDWPRWFSTGVRLLTMGALATAFWAVVMYVGVLPDKWKIKKKLKSVRAELSVIACLLSLGQVVYFSNHFIRFFTDPGSMQGYYEYATIASLVLLIIMIPLMLTSFYTVRKWMSQKSWKRLQNWSYVFYVALYLHVVGIYLWQSMNGRYRDLQALEAYTAIFVTYFVLRIIKYLYDRKKYNERLAANAGTTVDEDDDCECIECDCSKSTDHSDHADEHDAKDEDRNKEE